MYTIQCDCCKENYSSSDFSAWHEYDDARQWAIDDGWVENEHRDGADHYCPKCFSIDRDDMVTTSNGITFQN